MAHIITLDGFEVNLYRSTIDGRIVVDIDSSETGDADHDADECPKFRLIINEHIVESEEL